ncbi:MAG: MotA/TolQ/ExbB proton channel family protein [Bacteriovoracaceae bacterium]|nr:MotA/TolQ/ExbB proton channel family protein [Bacteriovoracaceae bacterium]
MNLQFFSFANIAENIVMWLLGFSSVVSLSLILERYFYLKKISKESVRTLEAIEKGLATSRLEVLDDVAKSPDSILSRACLYATKHIEESGEQGLQEVFNTYTITVRPKLERSLSYLGSIGSNAPYVGLLGTVLGIMKTFHDMSQASSDAGQKVVMAGISFSLVATAAGLSVAIPSVYFFNYFHKKVQSILDALSALSELSIAYAKKRGRKNEIKV